MSAILTAQGRQLPLLYVRLGCQKSERGFGGGYLAGWEYTQDWAP